VCLDSHDGLHVGVAIAPACRVERRAGVALTPGVAYRVTDRTPPR
jgi:hypothetical protein